MAKKNKQVSVSLDVNTNFMAQERQFDYTQEQKLEMISMIQRDHASFAETSNKRADEAADRFTWVLALASQAAYTQFEDPQDGTQFDMDLIHTVEKIEKAAKEEFQKLREKYQRQ